MLDPVIPNAALSMVNLEEAPRSTAQKAFLGVSFGTKKQQASSQFLALYLHRTVPDRVPISLHLPVHIHARGFDAVLGKEKDMARGGSGKSKGCRTCRQRRVKCDERQPSCERCEKGDFQCEGFAREHRFVDEVARTVRHAQKSAAKQKSTSPRSSRDPPPSPPKRQALLPDVTLVGFQDNVLVSFLLSNLFAGMTVASTPWMQRQAEDTRSLTARSSILALSKVYFGRMHRQQNIISQGFALYGDALQNLNHDLQDEEKAWSLSVLTSAMTLQIYEFIAFSSSSGWLKHAGGVGRLIELRGPWRHQSPTERQILESNRVTIALECLVKRRRCFLEHPNWKNIPWALEPDSKTPLILIHDLLMDLPGLMEDAVALQNPALSPDELFFHHQILSEKVEAYLVQLYAWRTTWELTNPGACYEVPSPLGLENEQPLFSSILHYSTLAAANEITMYNTLLLLILRLEFDIIGSEFNASAQSLLVMPFTTLSPSLPSNPSYLPGQAPSSQAIATEICRSAEYHLLEKQSSAGAFFLLFPLRVAYQAFEDGEPERTWLKALMQRVAEISGWEIGRNIGNDGAVGR